MVFGILALGGGRLLAKTVKGIGYEISTAGTVVRGVRFRIANLMRSGNVERETKVCI